MFLMQNKLMTLIAQKLSYLGLKGQLISQNIASADAPGYRRKTINDFQQVLKSQKSKAKNYHDALKISPDHIKTTHDQVNKEWEIMDYTEVSTDYQTVTSLYRRWNTALKSVIGKN